MKTKGSKFQESKVTSVIIVFLVIRILSLVFSVYTIATFGTPKPPAYLEKGPYKFVSQADPQNGLLAELVFSGWSRWDSGYFLKIAMNGYAVEDGSTAFAPIYPFLIRIVALFTGNNYLRASLLISNFFAAVSVLILYKVLVQETGNRNTAFRTVLLFLSFPTSFFLFAAYPESFFLTFLFACWGFARKGKWFWAAVAGMIATLTRFQGVSVTVMLLAYYVLRNHTIVLWPKPARITKFTHKIQEEYQLLSKSLMSGTHLIFLFLPVSVYLLFQYWATNNFAQVAIKTYNTNWQNPLLTPWNAVYYLFMRLGNGSLYLMDFVNLLMVVLFGFLAVDGLRKLHPALSLYSIITLFVTTWITLGRLSIQPQQGEVFMSFVRYALSLFPLFIVLESWLRKPLLFIAVITIFLITQAAFLWLYLQWYFVA